MASLQFAWVGDKAAASTRGSFVDQLPGSGMGVAVDVAMLCVGERHRVRRVGGPDEDARIDSGMERLRRPRLEEVVVSGRTLIRARD